MPVTSPNTRPLDRFRDYADRFSLLVDGAAGRWAAPSPCPGWTAADVVTHVVGSQRDYLAQRGFVPDGAPGDDPATGWTRHRDWVEGLLAQPEIADAAYDGYFGPTTIGAMLADFYGWDLVVHGWDLARATGQEWTIDDAEAARLGSVADGWGDALYADGICGPALTPPEGASGQDRLLARLGRDPRWTPAD